MRRGGILARRYAKALFLVGQDRHILPDLRRDMKLFADTLRENQDFYYFFDSPEVTRKEKVKKLEEIFGDSFTEVFHQFLMVVLKKGRQNLFLEIADAFNTEWDEYHNRVKARVASSIQLTPEMQKEIREQLTRQLKKEVILVPEVNPSLIGGIKITIDGKVIDGSIQGQLLKMKQYLLDQSARVLN